MCRHDREARAARIHREIYPNDRYIEYTYDTTGRLKSVKDPFGYINQIGYDADGRIDELIHDTLGTASFSYNSHDQITQQVLGNGAYTNHDHDAYGRLDEIDLYDSADDRLVRHSWTYDAIWRKNDIDVLIPTVSYLQLDLTYDTASRLTRERFKDSSSGTAWDVQYAFDKSGNRTTYNPSSSYSLTYANASAGQGQNRETAASPGTVLSYDYKGNVTSRVVLVAGGNAYNYTWDAYDRLTQVSRTSQTTVNYEYDALGRLLYREQSSEKHHYYRVGLHRIAEEARGSESGADDVVFRPDTEASATAMVNGWYDWGSSGTVTLDYPGGGDAVRGKVVRLKTTSGDATDGIFLIGDNASGTVNPNDASFADTDRKHLGLWVRNANAGNAYQIGVLMQTGWGNRELRHFLFVSIRVLRRKGLCVCAVLSRLRKKMKKPPDPATASPWKDSAVRSRRRPARRTGNAGHERRGRARTRTPDSERAGVSGGSTDSSNPSGSARNSHRRWGRNSCGFQFREKTRNAKDPGRDPVWRVRSDISKV